VPGLCRRLYWPDIGEGWPSPNTAIILFVIYLLRSFRWVGLQAGIIPLFQRKCVRAVRSTLRWALWPGAVRRRLIGYPHRLPRASFARESELDLLGGQSHDHHHARLAAPGRSLLSRDLGRRSCRSHRRLLDVISWKHRMEGAILAELCTTIALLSARLAYGVRAADHEILNRLPAVFPSDAYYRSGLPCIQPCAHTPLHGNSHRELGPHRPSRQKYVVFCLFFFLFFLSFFAVFFLLVNLC
jgi:hypothetical protein